MSAASKRKNLVSSRRIWPRNKDGKRGLPEFFISSGEVSVTPFLTEKEEYKNTENKRESGTGAEAR